nr:TolC family protein [Niabella beijingensis]
MQLLNTNTQLLPEEDVLQKLPVTGEAADDSLITHPALALQSQNIKIAEAGIGVSRNENKPEFSGRFFSQRLYGMSDPFTGFSVSVAVPLFGLGANRNKVKAAEMEAQVQQKQLVYDQQLFATRRAQLLKEVQRNNNLLDFYKEAALRQAGAIIKASSMAYEAGEISFAEMAQFLTQAIDTRRNYLESLNSYNQSVIQYYYFLNQ